MAKPQRSRATSALKTVGLLACSVLVAATALLSSSAGAQGALDWIQVGDDVSSNTEFGDEVSMSADGNRMVVGVDSVFGPNRVFVFELTGGDWVQVGARIDLATNTFGRSPGVAISADGSRIVVGDPNAGPAGNRTGQLRVFDFVGGAWVQVGATIDGDAPRDWFGESAAISADGSRIAATAPGNDANGPFAGHVRIFDLQGGDWVQVGPAIEGVEDNGLISPLAMSADGTRISARFVFVPDTTFREDTVRAFDFDGSAWVQVGSDIVSESNFDILGDALALNETGSRMVVGAPRHEGVAPFSGRVRVFDLVNDEWELVGAPLDGLGREHFFGQAVAITPDGSRLAVASPIENLRGAVRIFELAGGTWVQTGSVINGPEQAAFFGESVAISADGSRVGVGAPEGDDSFVRVLDFAPAPADLLRCGGLEVTVDLAAGDEPTPGRDVIRGTAGDDVIDGLGGADTICGLQGDDIISGGTGADVVFGGRGNDSIDGGSDRDLLVGGAGNDTILGGLHEDRLRGGPGADDLDGGPQRDRLSGGDGNDVIRGGAGLDTLFGNVGRDQLFGGPDDDVIRGGAWLDTMDGGDGNDGCTLTDPAGLTEERISCETGVFGR